MRRITLGDIAMTTEYAWKLVGIPYKLGGNVPQDGGMDCSAFCLELLRSLGLWNTSDATAQMIYDRLRDGSFIATKVMDIPTAEGVQEGVQEGDFLFFGKSTKEITHTAYALNDRHMLEAGGTDKTGMIRLRKQSWRKDLVAVLRFI